MKMHKEVRIYNTIQWNGASVRRFCGQYLYSKDTVHLNKAIFASTVISGDWWLLQSHRKRQAQKHYKNAQRSLIHNSIQRDIG